MQLNPNHSYRCFLSAWLYLFLVMTVPSPVIALANGAYDSTLFFKAAPVKGEDISQVFSRTISTQVQGFDRIVKRISGTGTYRLSSTVENQFLFDSQFVYDGNPAASGTTKIRGDGSESCWQDNCGMATDASGLLFNVLLWGKPPERIGVGTHWHTKIPIPWELGPAGEEDVTVMALNASTGSVTLLRKGSGQGSFDNDPTQLTMTREGKEFLVTLQAGRATWSGYTTIERGIVISDELMVERSLLLCSAELGSKEGTQRQYILLNKMPQASSWERS